MLEYKLYGHADDFTLVAMVPPPLDRVAVAESLNRDLNRFGEWGNFWGMKLNGSKTNTIIAPQITHNAFPVSPIYSGRNCCELRSQ